MVKRIKNKLYLIWLIVKSDAATVIVLIGEERTIAHNMTTEEVKASIKHLEETVEND